MSNQTQPAVTVIPVNDDRPPTPPMPTLWLCRYHGWTQYGNERPQWKPRTSMFARTSPLEIDKEAAELISKGHRNVQIIRIAGDIP